MKKEIDSGSLLRERRPEGEIPPEVLERFQTLAEVAPQRAVIFLAEAKTGTLLGINEGMIGITGSFPRKIFEQSVFGWMTPEAEVQIKEARDETGRDNEFEIRCLIPTWRGDRAAIQAAISLVAAEGKKFLIGNGVDITDSYRREQRLEAGTEKLRQETLIDELTGLYNRRGFLTLGQQQLETARRIGVNVFLLFADFDRLKAINDTFGHLEGDQALIQVSKVFKGTCREADIIARASGDEFVIIGVETRENSGGGLVSRLQEALDAHNAETNNPYQLSLSFGLARDDPE
jgi:diguanylate cyclase (GGDEF)-like protein